jgi:WD40 repeat protein
MKLLNAGPTRRLLFSPDGRLLLVAGCGIWELPAGVERHSGLPTLYANFVGPDTLVSLVARQSVARIDLASGEVLDPIVQPTTDGHLWNLKVSPDATRLVAANLGPFGRPALFWWSLPDLKPLEEWPQEGFPRRLDLTFTADGTGLAVIDGTNTVGLFDISTRRLRWQAAFRVVQDEAWVAASPCGRYVAAGSGPRASVFDAANGAAIGQLRQEQKYFLGASFTPDGRFLATVSNEKTVKFFDTSSWTLRHELAWQIGKLRAIAFSPDGMLAAAGGLGRKVVVWDLDL